jgi:RHS repeat-associated protein
LYQGAFAELDDDIGWTDFALRNYDAQIGRWVQQDPYQQFASPYVVMGDDPVNNIDPSGGISLPGGGELLEEVIVTAVRRSSKVFSAATNLEKLVKAVNFSAKVFKVVDILNDGATTNSIGNKSNDYTVISRTLLQSTTKGIYTVKDATVKDDKQRKRVHDRITWTIVTEDYYEATIKNTNTGIEEKGLQYEKTMIEFEVDFDKNERGYSKKGAVHRSSGVSSTRTDTFKKSDVMSSPKYEKIDQITQIESFEVESNIIDWLRKTKRYIEEVEWAKQPYVPLSNPNEYRKFIGEEMNDYKRSDAKERVKYQDNTTIKR